MRPADTWNKKFIDLSNSAVDKDGKYHAQNGEAGILDAIFKVCIPKNKWCVEFGAGNGKDLSNTYDLIQASWSSLQIEARQDQYEQLVETFRGNDRVITVKELVGNPVDTYNLKYVIKNDIETIMERFQIPLNLDLMSIDIDSYDYEIWLNMKRCRPNVIVIECNSQEEDFSVLNYDPSWSVKTPTNTWYGGATVGLLNRLAEQKGYLLVCVAWCNAIYIENDFAVPLLKHD